MGGLGPVEGFRCREDGGSGGRGADSQETMAMPITVAMAIGDIWTAPETISALVRIVSPVIGRHG
jgi:hypothetical protein